jgi:nicotinamidase-related amidase
MAEKDALFDGLRRLLAGGRAIGIPIICTEQIPEALGPTRAELANCLQDSVRISKSSFSCCGEPRFMDALVALNRRQVIICGIETHVCVCQTAVELLGADYEVYVVADAVSSRSLANKNLALERLRYAGAVVSSVEMALFELLRVAEGRVFKEVLRIIK